MADRVEKSTRDRASHLDCVAATRGTYIGSSERYHGTVPYHGMSKHVSFTFTLNCHHVQFQGMSTVSTIGKFRKKLAGGALDASVSE